MVKKKKIAVSKELLKDVKQLSKKMEENTYIKQIVFSELDKNIKNDLSMKEVDTHIRLNLGPGMRRLLAYVFSLDTKQACKLVESLKESGISPETVNFLFEIIQKYGYYFDDYKIRVKYPNSIDTIISESILENDGMFLLKLDFRRELESFVIVSKPISFLSMADALIDSIMDQYKTMKKQVPDLKLQISKKDLKKIKKSVSDLESLLNSNQKTAR